MAVLAISLRMYYQLKRNPYTFAVLIFLPVIMVFMFFIAFSSLNSAGNTTYSIIVVNNDNGLDDNVAESFKVLSSVIGINLGKNTNNTVDDGFSSLLINIMNTTTYSGDNGVNIFTIREYSSYNDAVANVENRNFDALMVIPEDFSNTTMSAFNNNFKLENGLYLQDMFGILPGSFPPELLVDYPTTSNSTIQIVGDEGYLNYQISKQIISLFIDGFSESFSQVSALGGKIQVNLENITIKNYSVFDGMAPGLMVFAILMQGGMLSAIIADEIVVPNKTMPRIRLSLIKPWEYVVGATLVQLTITPIQVGAVFGLILLLGFNPAGNIVLAFFLYWLGGIFGLVMTFFSAAIFSNPNTAGSSSGFLATPMAFASGAFFEVPPIILLQNAFPTPSGDLRNFLLWDLLPPTHLINAVKSVLLYDFSLTDVFADLAFFTISSIVLLIIAIFAFNKARFTGDI